MSAPDDLAGSRKIVFRVVCTHPAVELPDVVSEPATRQHAEAVAEAMRETLGHHRGWTVTLQEVTAP